MGGAQSSYDDEIGPAPTVDVEAVRRQAQAGVGQKSAPLIVNKPFPGPTAETAGVGVSTAVAAQCLSGVNEAGRSIDNCQFIVPQNQSTSVVTLTRPVQEGDAELDALAITSNMQSTETDNPPCAAQGHEEFGPRQRINAETVRVTCYMPCPPDQRPNQVGKDQCEWLNRFTGGAFGSARYNLQAGPRPKYTLDVPVKGLNKASEPPPTVAYLGDKKLLIKPDQPFKITFNDESHTISSMAIYRPCPYRIENVQADAVLSLNDYSDPTATFVALIPLSAKLRYGKPGDFVGRVMQNVNGFILDEKTMKYNPLTIPVGHDWQLTNVLEATQDPDGANTVTGAYFTWVTIPWTNRRAFSTAGPPETIHYEWVRDPSERRVTTVLFEESAGISYLTSTYLQMLPYAPSAESAPPIEPTTVRYSPVKCTTCARGPATSFEDAQAFLEQTGELMDPKTIAFLISTFLIAVAALVAIYFALDSALGGNGRFFMSGPVSIAGWLAAPRPVAPPPQ